MSINHTRRKLRPFPFTIIRLWPHHHAVQAEFNELLDALRRYRPACDEVWLTTELGFPGMDAHARSADLMSRAAGKLRRAGIEPGLQIANTLGHGDVPQFPVDGAVWPRIVGTDGREAPSCFCPRSPEILAHHDKLTRLYAAWKPGSVWIDDDLRMHHHAPVDYGCFCPRCLRDFSTDQGREYDRPSLVAALGHPTDGSVRLAWTRFNGKSLAQLAGVIARAAHAVAPKCRLGYEHCGHEWSQYPGPNFRPIFEAMSSATGLPAASRPGHGFYNDHQPRGMILKGYSIARQVARLPECVGQVCPEIENFTHNAFGKTAHGMAVESSLDLALGCNSLSYALLCSGHEPMAWYETLLAKIVRYRPFWERYVRASEGTTPGGLDVLFGMEHVARPLLSGEKPFAWQSVDFSSLYEMAPLGLPFCPSSRRACGAMLHADAVAGFSDEALRQVLAGGVMMDGLAAQRVQDRGMGELLGVRVTQMPQALFGERISADPLNGEYVGRLWTKFFSPNGGAFMLEAFSPDIRVLGHYQDNSGLSRGAASTLFENASGGRVAVFGNFGWDSAPSAARRNQYIQAADWISRGQLPVIVQSVAQVMAVPRVDKSDRLISIFLLNACIEKTQPLQLRLRGTSAKSGKWLLPESKERKLAMKADGADKLCKIPALAAWSVGCLMLD